MKNRLFNIVITVMITALLLTGAVPSFAWGIQGDAGASAEAGTMLRTGRPLPEEVYGEEKESVVLPAIKIDSSDAPKIHGKAAVVMDLDTGTVVYEKNADKVREPASLTKILTCMVALEHLDMDQEITVPENVETEGSLMWIDPGEVLTAEELFYGMMLESGNDAAQVLGLAAADGDMDRFCDMMNQKARECGALHTDYKNPNGLNEDRTRLNYTTARDLALMSREAMKNPMFRRIVSTPRYTVPATNRSEKRRLYNSNLCLWQDKAYTRINGKEVPFKYKGCDGIKTGFTSDAGYCLVGDAQHGETGFLVVVLGAEDSEERFQDTIRLWDYAFKKYETFKALKAGDTAGVNRVWGGQKRTVDVGTERDLGVTIEKGTSDQQEFTTEFRLDQDKIEAPVRQGEKVGKALIFNAGGRLVGQEDLYTLAAVAEGGPLSHIGIADEDLPMAGGIACGVLLLLAILFFIGRARRKKARRRKKDAMKGELANMRTAGIGMTARELTDVTGVEEPVPVPRGPERISDEELKRWETTSTIPPWESGGNAAGQEGRQQKGRARRPQARPERIPQDSPRRSNRIPNVPGSSRFSDAAGPSRAWDAPGTSHETGTLNGSRDSDAAGGSRYPDAPNADKAPRMKITPRKPFDEELFAMFESTEVYDANQPRRHGKLTSEEVDSVMRATKTPGTTGTTEAEGGDGSGDGGIEARGKSRRRRRWGRHD